MNDERIDHHSGFHADHRGWYDMEGTGRHRRATEASHAPLVPPDPAWDPAEELAYLLQDAMAAERAPAERPACEETSVTAPPSGSPLGKLRDITAELPPLRVAPTSHRKLRERRRPSGVRTLSCLIAALVAVITSMVSVFGGMATYEPLRLAAVLTSQNSAVSWWPLLVYGPWLVAALSILRAALHRCRAVHSWAVVLLFSSAAVFLCVVQSHGTATDVAAAALPTCAALACFQQLVRQIRLTRPHHRTRPRHRSRLAASTAAFADTESVRVTTDRRSQPHVP
ncbi:DUF2637 domain-containing protein [Streptomyces sp. HNM0663]|uniref:DUF2637 domain-containing protein n=1 Tax=Streptomyces chengmaiensis TaxID=3040919 RepID=A0ABT6HGN4_9ACTN|nr:DUF2637 domain-containing protein [Streptomyces chengmaiensis]MDH2387741.1 DUF2637 domain-containing protein [Streptomyces chengmaiensis]